MRYLFTLAVIACALFAISAHAAPPASPPKPAAPASPLPEKMFKAMPMDTLKPLAAGVKKQLTEFFMKHPEVLKQYRDLASKVPGLKPSALPNLAMSIDNPEHAVQLLTQLDLIEKPAM